MVYIRHTVQPGYKLTKAPAVSERMGLAHLFRIELAPKGKTEVEIEEATPVFKTTDVRAADGMDLVRVYLLSAAGNEALRKQVAELLKLQKETANVEQQIETTREQMQEYRSRMDELHGQILSLREVRTGASAADRALEKKMQDILDKVSGATIALVNLQEKLMISRVHFQDYAVAELTLETARVRPRALRRPRPDSAAPLFKVVSRWEVSRPPPGEEGALVSEENRRLRPRSHLPSVALACARRTGALAPMTGAVDRQVGD